MQTYISMLRGINVSGQKKIRMADLKSLYESLGLENVQTYVQSGNVVFDSEEQDVAKLRKSIEAQIESTFGFSVPVLIRSADDFRAHHREPSIRAGRADQGPGHVFV